MTRGRGSSRRQRLRLAQGLERVLRDAERPRGASVSAAVPVQREEVCASRPLLRRLVGQLQRVEDPPQGSVVLIRRLLTDPNGPLFAPSPPGTLWDELEEAILALRHERASKH